MFRIEENTIAPKNRNNQTGCGILENQRRCIIDTIFIYSSKADNIE
jgi:hypothetical protein